MSMTDPIADLLTRIRNVNSLNRSSVKIPYSRIKEEVVKVLQREGFVTGYEVGEATVGKELTVTMKYGPEGEKVINKIQRVSRPGRRVFRGINDLGVVLQGMGIYILSTNKGVLSDNEARAQKVGGEVICEVY